MPRIFSGKVILYFFLLLVADLCWSPWIAVGGAQPVFLYLMVVYSAFQWGAWRSVPVAIVAGLARDLTGSLDLGVETLVLFISTLVLDFLVQKLDRESQLVRMIAAFLFVFWVLLELAYCSSFFGMKLPVTGHALLGILTTALYTAVWTPVFFGVTSRWFHDRTPMKQYELFGR